MSCREFLDRVYSFCLQFYQRLSDLGSPETRVKLQPVDCNHKDYWKTSDCQAQKCTFNFYGSYFIANEVFFFFFFVHLFQQLTFLGQLSVYSVTDPPLFAVFALDTLGTHDTPGTV